MVEQLNEGSWLRESADGDSAEKTKVHQNCVLETNLWVFFWEKSAILILSIVCYGLIIDKEQDNSRGSKQRQNRQTQSSPCFSGDRR